MNVGEEHARSFRRNDERGSAGPGTAGVRGTGRALPPRAPLAGA